MMEGKVADSKRRFGCWSREETEVSLANKKESKADDWPVIAGLDGVSAAWGLRVGLPSGL